MQFYNKKKEMRYMRMEQANYIKAIFTAIFAFYRHSWGSGSAGNLAGGM